MKKKVRKHEIKKPFFLSKYFDEKEFITLLIIALGGFILRLFYIIEISDSLFIKNPASDSLIYLEWGKEIASGSWFGERVFYMSPVYSYFLALIHLVFDDAVFVTQVIQILLNTINIFLVYAAAKRIFSQQEAYISAVITAVYSGFIFYSGLILIEILHTFLFTIFLIYLIRMRDELKNREMLTAGIIFGLLILFRGNIILFLPVLLIWLYFRYGKNIKRILKPAGIFLTGAFVPLFVITLNNFISAGDIVLLTSNGGINFYIGNNPYATGIYMNPKEFRLETDLTGHDYAEKETGHPLTPGEVSNFWFAKGFEFVKEEPVSAMKLFFTKLLLFIDDSENPQSPAMDENFFAENYSNILKIPLPGFYIILLLAFAGIILNLDKRENFNILLLLLVVYAAATALFFVTGRFRVPVVPVLIIFAGAGIYRTYLIIMGKEFQSLIKPAAVIIILIGLNYLLTPSFTFSNYGAFSHIGKIHFDNKEYDKAIEYYLKSVKLQDDYSTYVHLGNAYAAKKEFDKSRAAFATAIKMNPDYELAWFNLGSLNIQQMNPEEALRNFEKVLELNPAFEEAYKNAGIIYYMYGDYQKALEYFQKYLVYAKDEHSRYTVLRDIEELKKLLSEK